MRPSFSYLDKADSKHREREAANEGGDSSQDEAEEDVKAVTVRRNTVTITVHTQ